MKVNESSDAENTDTAGEHETETRAKVTETEDQKNSYQAYGGQQARRSSDF